MSKSRDSADEQDLGKKLGCIRAAWKTEKPKAYYLVIL